MKLHDTTPETIDAISDMINALTVVSMNENVDPQSLKQVRDALTKAGMPALFEPEERRVKRILHEAFLKLEPRLQGDTYIRNLVHVLGLFQKAKKERSWVNMAFAMSSLRDTITEIPHTNPLPWE